MTRQTYNDGEMAEKYLGIRTVIRKIVLGRDGELALIDASCPQSVSPEPGSPIIARGLTKIISL